MHYSTVLYNVVHGTIVWQFSVVCSEGAGCDEESAEMAAPVPYSSHSHQGTVDRMEVLSFSNFNW